MEHTEVMIAVSMNRLTWNGMKNASVSTKAGRSEVKGSRPQRIPKATAEAICQFFFLEDVASKNLKSDSIS